MSNWFTMASRKTIKLVAPDDSKARQFMSVIAKNFQRWGMYYAIGECFVDLHIWCGTIRLSEIRAYEPGKGAGRQAMKVLTDLADEIGVPITATVQPTGPGLNRKQLHQWYARNGFQRADQRSKDNIIRNPSGGKGPANQTPLDQAIASFPDKTECEKPEYGHGDCDSISIRFLRHAANFGLKGTLLAVDYPTKKPTRGFELWGGPDAVISHYVAYFPDLKVSVDWTARQFWDDAPVPLIQSQAELQSAWKELPFGWKDSREEEQHG